MNINFKFLLLGTSLSLIPTITNAQCAVTDCQQLGYTSLKSCDNGLKCPFGEYWACPKVEEKAVLGECTGYAKNCKIGDILNSDGTCTTDKVSGKTPIGVVVYISGDNCGYAMTTNPIQTNIAWGGYGTDMSTLTNYETWQTAITDFKSCENTQKIIQAGDASIYPAAWAAVNYTPTAAPTTQGKWCLPAAGTLNSLYINLSAVNNTISKLGGKQLTDDYEQFWSSSEYDYRIAWHFCPYFGRGSGGISNSYKYGNPAVSAIRPVLPF